MNQQPQERAAQSNRLTDTPPISTQCAQIVQTVPAPQVFPGVRRIWRRGPSGAPWRFLVPGFVLYAFVVLVPSARGAIYAITGWNGLTASQHFVGLTSFVRIVHDATAGDAIRRTFFIAVGITIIQNAIGLLLALEVNTQIKSGNLLRVSLLAPAVTTPLW